MRPKTIVYFEWIFLGTLLVGIPQSYLALAEDVRSDPNAVAAVLTIMIFRNLLFATLTLLVSRRRSKIAMWISIALSAIALFGFLGEAIPRGVQLGSIMNIIMTALQFIGQVVVYGLLFTPSARRWMNREDKLLEVFH